MMRNVALVRAIAVALTVLVVRSASAHILLENDRAEPGGYKAVFRVPHGCDGSPTVAITITLPEGVIGVKPMPKPGWEIAMTTGPYARSYEHYHGRKVSEGVKSVTWSGGRLLDEHFDEFTLSVYLTDGLPAGSMVYFAVSQTCESGTIDWAEIPAAGQDGRALKTPAPGVRLRRTDGKPGDGAAAKPGHRRR